MENEKLFDDMLKEKANNEKRCAPNDITMHMLQVISDLPENGCNNWLLRKIHSYKLWAIAKDIMEVAVFAVIIFMIPILLTINHGKQEKLSNKDVASMYVDNKIKTSLLKEFSITNIESVKEEQNGHSITTAATFLPGKDNDKIENIINLIKASSDIRISVNDELNALGMKGGGPPYIEISLKSGKKYDLVPAMWIKKIDNNGGEFNWYEDRIILFDNGDKQTFYTCYSKELVNCLRSITK